MDDHKIIIQFWGVRGTLPVPGKDTVRYGGNTSCVTLNFPNKPLFIFDAGTGIKKLSDFLIQQNISPISAKLFITHPHWDHINAIPYFAPFYIAGNEFEIFCACQEDNTVEKLIFSQMDSIYFPITKAEMKAKFSFCRLDEGSYFIDDVNIQTHRLCHPGICLGYRVQYKEKSICYITDNELYPNDSSEFNQKTLERLIQFIYKTDVLIIDTTYTDEEYINKINWGHSCVSQVVDIADRAKVKLLCLYHHDPGQIDLDIDSKLKMAQSLLKLRHSKIKCIAPHEGDKLIV